ncbi:hypothetical protein ACFOHT_02975 [Massilia oculi]|uniref:hypothetical protein n=1 Tax=Massilia oculi TaxID=945844 RepID=UPI0013B38B72|nr:hypothetical protein [Massilia oculi]
MKRLIELFFKYNNQLAVILFILCFLIIWIKNLSSSASPRLEALLNGALAGATIPTGFALIFCAIDPSYVSRLEGINVNLSVAGVVLVFIAIRGIMGAIERPSN